MIILKCIRRKNPKDTTKSKFYVSAVNQSTISRDALLDQITAENTLTRTDVITALSAIEDQMINVLLEGQSVRLGDLGAFRLSIISNGAELAEDYSTKLIKAVRVVFVPSPKFRAGMNPQSSPNIKLAMA